MLTAYTLKGGKYTYTWTQESFVLAKKFAFGEPVLSEGTESVLTRSYGTDARNVARSQAALAATRLANLVNEAFKWVIVWTLLLHTDVAHRR
jgi:hypothetical protein